jgi:hypothetical protein
MGLGACGVAFGLLLVMVLEGPPPAGFPVEMARDWGQIHPPHDP